VRPDDQGLIFVVADNADAGDAVQFGEIIFKFTPELGVGDIVNKARISLIIFNDQAPPHGT